MGNVSYQTGKRFLVKSNRFDTHHKPHYSTCQHHSNKFHKLKERFLLIFMESISLILKNP